MGKFPVDKPLKAGPLGVGLREMGNHSLKVFFLTVAHESHKGTLRARREAKPLLNNLGILATL